MTPNGSRAARELLREPLSRAVVIDEALAMIDESGPQGLSMRKLAQRLEVHAMSLYTYVSGREDMLEAVVARLLDHLIRDLAQEPTQTWKGYLQALAHQVRAIAVDHPQAFPLVATRHPATPWLRPPLHSVYIVEDLLAHLAAGGFDDTKMVATYRAFSSFLLGQLLLESATRGADTGPGEEPPDEGNAPIPHRDGDVEVDLTGAPLVHRLQPQLSEDHSAEEFETGLETLLNRLDTELSQ